MSLLREVGVLPTQTGGPPARRAGGQRDRSLLGEEQRA
jgi:hypothetical protein